MSGDIDPWVLADLDRTIILAKSSVALEKIIEDMKHVFSKAWKDQSRTAIKSSLRILEGTGRQGLMTPGEIDLVVSDMEKHLGAGLKEAVREPVFEIQEAAFLQGGSEEMKATGVDFNLRMQDTKALAVLQENTLFWVGDYFGDDLQDEIRTSLRKLYEGGYQRSEIMWDFKIALEDKLPRSAAYWDLLADHTCTKVREIGRVAGYEQAGVTAIRVRARIDHNTTQICRRLHGHIIATKDLRKQVDRYLAACETKDKEKIKGSWPWWNDKKAKSLQTVDDVNAEVAAGNIGLPPYHARCRTITVSEMILEPGSHDVPEKEQALFEDGVSPIENTMIEKPKRKTWEMIPGSQLGSNPGGKVIGPGGKMHYAKFYGNAEQARTEFAANDLHNKLGLGAPKTRLETIEFNGEKRLAVVTEWMDDMTPLSRVRGKKWTKNDKDQIAKHYLGASLNGNWDVVGLEFDNLAKKGRKWYCVDQGGSYMFRARGGAKTFGPQVLEMDSLLSPGRNAAEIFNPVLGETIQADPAKYRKWLAKLSDKKIRNSVTAAGMDSSLADTIIARRKAIEARLRQLEGELAPPLETSQIVKGVVFRDPEHQKLFDELVEKYKDLDATQLRALCQQECPNTLYALNRWQGSTQGASPSAFKMKVELMEGRNLHAYSKQGGITREKIRKDPLFKLADEKLPDDEYIRMRAMTQAYYRTKKRKKVRLYRGTGGRTGSTHAQKIREIRSGTPGWQNELYEIEQNAAAGWSSSKAIASGSGGPWGHRRGGITEKAQISVEDIILPHDFWPKTGYHNEKEFIVIGDRFRTVPLNDIAIPGDTL
jgi:hypothetical protein